MFHPLSLYVGLRYARARTHRYFVSFITWVSLVGVCVGVAALIVILSVMNGFASDLRDRLGALSAQVRINAVAKEHPAWDEVRQQIASLGGALEVETQAELPVLAVHLPQMRPLTLHAAGAAMAKELTPYLVDGGFAPVEQGEGILIGTQAARYLGLAVGDYVTLMTPGVVTNGVPDPVRRELTVAGLFEVGLPERDLYQAYASVAMMEDLGAARAGAEGLEVRLPDPLGAAAYAGVLRKSLDARWPDVFKVTDWTEEHASYFRAIRIEKTMVALILLLTVAVAAFNIVAMLVMVVNDKRTDIAILRTLGASPSTAAAIFIAQGLVIGWLGVFAGVGLGWLIARNVEPILEFINRVSGWQMVDADVFLITQVPSELHRMDVLLVAGSALVVTALATIYPARRAAATSPAEALRYE